MLQFACVCVFVVYVCVHVCVHVCVCLCVHRCFSLSTQEVTVLAPGTCYRAYIVPMQK